MEPKDFFRVILRRRRTVITAILVVVGVSGFLSMRKEPQYAAACKVRISAVGPAGGSQISEDPKKNPTEIYASFEEMQQILQSPLAAEKVASRLKVPFERVVNSLNAGHELNTGIFNLTAVNSDARFAAQLCDNYMAQFLEERVSAATEKVEKTLTLLKLRIASYTEEITKMDRQIEVAKSQEDQNNLRFEKQGILSDRAKARRDVSDLETALEQKFGGGGEVISFAGAAGIKVGPDHKKDAILGLIMGLIFGAGLALVREYMDDTVRDKEGALRDIGLPVLASIPSGRSLDDPFGEEDSGGIEAARMLRTNLTSQGLGGDVQCVVVTSTLAKRTSATLANLAGAIAEAGRTVLVLGADFRNARVHESFGVGNAVGLTNVIRGQVTFEKAIRPVPGQAGVYVMPSGPVIGNPGELLSTEEMAMVVRRARKWADIVLVDAPPVLAAADASLLGTYADGVLMVMSAGQTPRAQANEAKEQLKAAGARLLGAVMFGASDNGNGAKVLALPFRRGDGGDDLPPLSPYGGDFGDFGGGGGYDFGSGYGAGGGYNAGAYGGSFGQYGGGFDDDSYAYDGEEGFEDDVEDSRPHPRARGRSAKPKPRKRGPQKKIVAAGTSSRIRAQDRETGRAPRRAGSGFYQADDARPSSGRTKATRTSSSSSNGTRGNGRTGATARANGRSTQQRARTGQARKPARPARRPYDQDLF